MPFKPEDFLPPRSSLPIEGADFELKKQEREYKKDLLDSIHAIRDALQYLVEQERKRENSEHRAEPES
jgi:hypothetical protein